MKLSAPAYVDRLMVWIEEQFQNPAIFPKEKSGTPPLAMRAQRRMGEVVDEGD